MNIFDPGFVLAAITRIRLNRYIFPAVQMLSKTKIVHGTKLLFVCGKLTWYR